jgi:hypothetical protein
MPKVFALLMTAMLASPAMAQMTDWCGTPLPFQADPSTALLWRLRCTIQTLDRERAEAEDHVTTAEVDKAISEAHLKAVSEELEKVKTELKKKESEPPEKKKDK